MHVAILGVHVLLLIGRLNIGNSSGSSTSGGLVNESNFSLYFAEIKFIKAEKLKLKTACLQEVDSTGSKL